MTEGTQGLLVSAIKGRYSSLKDTLTEENVSSVWDNVAAYVEKLMTQMKGVQIPGLGVFSISQTKIEVGNNKCVITQRPVFNVSEKFAQIHGLQSQKYHVPGTVPILPLNFAAISYESPFDRDTIERCVKETIRAASLAVAAKRNVELCFPGIGRLTIRDGRAKMKFYKEFINQIDATGKLADSLVNRSGMLDSVMSDHLLARPHSSNTIVLPRVNSSPEGTNHRNIYGNLKPVAEEGPGEEQEHISNGYPHSLHLYPEMETTRNGADMALSPDDLTSAHNPLDEPYMDPATEHSIENIMREGNMITSHRIPIEVSQHFDEEVVPQEFKVHGGSRAASKIAMPISKANGISLTDELAISHNTPKSFISTDTKRMSHNEESWAGLKPQTPSKSSLLGRSRSIDNRLNEPAIKFKSPTPRSACGHPSAGQELCYLCHQRAKKNVPVYFTEELKRREEEEGRLLQQYQAMKDAEETLKDQERNWNRRRDLQKISAFNLGVAEAVQAKRKLKETEQQRSHIFSRRPWTPARFSKQDDYFRELNKQVDYNETARQKKKADEDYLGRIEQMQLAEELAAQKEQYLKRKAESTQAYKKALETQVRAKPAPMPEKEPDSEFFGKNDMNSDKMADRRHRARNLFQEQQSIVEQRKRDAILARLAEQQREEEVLRRAKDDLNDDTDFKHMVRFESRKRLENDWQSMSENKRAREIEDHLRSLSPGILVHEQCDRYKRCNQCMRRLHNCGESHVWSESRYIPGSRIMV